MQCSVRAAGGLMNPRAIGANSLADCTSDTWGGCYNGITPCSGVWTDLEVLFHNNVVIQWQTCYQNYNN
jgi:hypothetical protein